MQVMEGKIYGLPRAAYQSYAVDRGRIDIAPGEGIGYEIGFPLLDQKDRI
ncbi:MAG: hypothetical protein V3U33_06685 [candidate division NC10 bacterium]